MTFCLKLCFRFPVFVSALIFGGEPIAAVSRTLPYTASTVAVPVLKSSVNDAGQSIRYPRDGTAEVTMLRVNRLRNFATKPSSNQGLRRP